MDQTKIYPFESIGAGELHYVVIGARFSGHWLFVRHRERQSWEIPAGHIEDGESPAEAAQRELKEETGALDFSMEGVCDYRVESQKGSAAGRLFLAYIEKRSEVTDPEISAIRLSEELPGDNVFAAVQKVLFACLQKQLR